MKVGKLNWDDLKQIIDNNKSVVRNDVRIRSGIGEDCSVINFGEYECVVSTDPITGADKNIGKLAVNINCNDIASCGVEPVGILVTILVPPTGTIEDIKKIMEEIDEETKKLNVEILGGHTEVTTAVNRIVVSCTAIGKGKAGSAVATSGAKIGDEIVVTKLLCMEGTSIVVNDYLDRVRDVLTHDEIEVAKDYVNGISVALEGRIAGEFGVNSMHDITEGGVLGALWEVAQASNLGFEVYYDKMPISEITIKICEKLNIDPLKFISSGSMLITATDGEKLVEKLISKGIEATVIGKITTDRGILVIDGIKKDVLPPTRDELFSI
ncbi:AIR synthase family protein [Clostridium bowmanii]|uniref:AIR synthase family protein n=1 Tax=Clostridium bowmanii TaxID=132925 RepID=UPI001C0AA1B0|nr:AIR synthase family protein [Clostridium bowmanii]MBU3191057.1 AIR synthase family protein [Clostridium bowmanii]MCA1075509.1 AIR synthase family protein [Clostridium bowmanii]